MKYYIQIADCLHCHQRFLELVRNQESQKRDQFFLVFVQIPIFHLKLFHSCVSLAWDQKSQSKSHLVLLLFFCFSFHDHVILSFLKEVLVCSWVWVLGSNMQTQR